MTTDLYLLKTRHHFLEDSVHGWHEAGEDEDGGKVPLLPPKLAATSLLSLRRLIHLRSLDQLRTHCRRRIPGRTSSEEARAPIPTLCCALLAVDVPTPSPSSGSSVQIDLALGRDTRLPTTLGTVRQQASNLKTMERHEHRYSFTHHDQHQQQHQHHQQLQYSQYS